MKGTSSKRQSKRLDHDDQGMDFLVAIIFLNKANCIKGFKATKIRVTNLKIRTNLK
jgi:hypothetical protein